jgi:hypothetical protein
MNDRFAAAGVVGLVLVGMLGLGRTRQGRRRRRGDRRGAQRENGRVTYAARQSFEVTVTDTGEAGAVVDAAVDGGATEVSASVQVTYNAAR